MARKDRSHQEIWDDSALVNSWNEALEEYKKYHSLAAKGEKVDLTLEKAVADDVDIQNGPASNDTGSKDTTSPEIGIATTSRSPIDASAPPDKAANRTETVACESAVNTNGMAVPQTLLNSIQDESMKNLMMSWYYAGYYTGLLEGKQQAFTSMQQQQQQ